MFVILLEKEQDTIVFPWHSLSSLQSCGPSAHHFSSSLVWYTYKISQYCPIFHYPINTKRKRKRHALFTFAGTGNIDQGCPLLSVCVKCTQAVCVDVWNLQRANYICTVQLFGFASVDVFDCAIPLVILALCQGERSDCSVTVSRSGLVGIKAALLNAMLDSLYIFLPYVYAQCNKYICRTIEFNNAI